MIPQAAILNQTGPVVIGDRTITIRKLSLVQEQGLLAEMGRAAKEEFGPGGYFQRASKALQWLKDTNRGAEFAQAVARITEMEATGAIPGGDVIDSFRQTAKGVQIELFWRTRNTHPEIDRTELAAVVNETNALEIHLQILDVLTDGKKAPTPLS